MIDPESRMHRAVSALAYKLLAEGKVAAFDYACEHQESHWINLSLTPEQALERSLEGFVQPAKDRRVSPELRAAAEKMARVCSKPAPWDPAAQKGPTP